MAGTDGRSTEPPDEAHDENLDAVAASEGVGPPHGQGLWLFELAPRIVRLQDLVLRDMTPSITFGQFRLLQRVAEGRTTLTAISKVSTLSTPTLSERIEGAVRKGLLKRRAVPGDRRASMLQITPLGHACMDEAQRRLRLLSDWMHSPLSEADEDVFRALGRSLDDRLVTILRELADADRSVEDVIRTRPNPT